MKRSTFLAALVGAVVFSSSLIAGEVTKADRDKLVDHLKKTEAAFLKSIDGVSDAQWKWKSAPERWSVAETAEHITKAEDMLRGMVEGMMKAPAAPDLLAKTKGKDEVILTVIPDRSKKAQAPEPLVPKGTFATKAALVEAFKAARAKTLAIAGGTSDLRAYGMAGLPVGEVDAYQGVLFLSAHTERHTKQIEEVKATAGYPAK
ncbi:MAG: DinB family protein [Vicinamibacteraceae bacterium]